MTIIAVAVASAVVGFVVGARAQAYKDKRVIKKIIDAK